MKKLVALAVVMLLVAGYVSASWGFGRLTHERFSIWLQKVSDKGAGLIKVVDRQSSSGIFVSREDVTFEINTAAFDSLKGATPESEDVEDEADEDEPALSTAALRVSESQAPSRALRFTVRNDIAHGPFPEFTSFGIAKVSSRILLDEGTRHDLSKVFANQDPILVSSLVGFGGSGVVDVTSPAIDIKGEESIQWRGFTAHFAFGPAMQSITCDGKAPGLAVHKGESSDVMIGSVVFSCKMNRAFEDLYVGRASLAIEGMSANLGLGKPPFSIENIAYSGTASANGDFIDLDVKLLMKSLRTAGFNLNDAEYSFSIKHLHGPTYAGLSRKLSELSSSSALGDPTASIAMMGAFAEYGPKLLEYSPQIVIDRIGFSMPEGEAGLKGLVQLKDFSKGDLTAPNLSAAMLQKLQASVDVWIDEGLLQKDWGQPGVEQTAGSTTSDRVHAMEAQLSSLEQRGFIKRDDDRLTSHVEFKQGGLTANGLPIGPAAAN